MLTLYILYLGMSKGNPHLCLFFYGAAIAVIIFVIKAKTFNDMGKVLLVVLFATGGILSYS